jgi:hypothetical protein
MAVKLLQVRTSISSILIDCAGPMLGVPPSFMLSGTFPALYTAAQAVVDFLPAVPLPSLELELPLAVLDGFTRAYLLCNLIPPAVTTNASQIISTSPWTLLLSSFVRFIDTLASFLPFRSSQMEDSSS